MLRTAQDTLSMIHYLLSKAQEAWNELTEAEKEEINDLRDEQYSLGYCLRFGESAANEARDYAEGE